MAHFAKCVNGVVVDVIKAEQDFIDNLEDKHLWVQTSYNTLGGVHYHPETLQPDNLPAFRKNYATIGGTYDPVLDAFIPPKPLPSFVLNTETCLWEPPVEKPQDGLEYEWHEGTLSWHRQSILP